MPLYEYRCKTCGKKFEEIRNLGDRDTDLACPTCGEKAPERTLSAPTVKSCGARSVPGRMRFG